MNIGNENWVPVPTTMDTGITQLTGEVTAGPGSGSQAATVTNSAVIGKVLTGYVSGAGTVSATDTILSAIDKLNGNAALYLPLTGGTLTGNLTLSQTAADPVITFSTNSLLSTISMNHAGNPDLAILNGGNTGLVFSHAADTVTLINATFLGGGNGIRTTTGDISAGGFEISAILAATSTTRGFLLPRMTTAQRDAVATPATGLEIYNTTTLRPEYYTGVIWTFQPQVLAKIALTAQAADIGTTALFTAPATGLYGVDFYMVTTASDAGASNNLGVDLTYTDNSGSHTVSAIDGGTLALTSTGSNNFGTFPFEATAASVVSYAVSGGGTYGTARYSIYLTVTRLN